MWRQCGDFAVLPANGATESVVLNSSYREAGTLPAGTIVEQVFHIGAAMAEYYLAYLPEYGSPSGLALFPAADIVSSCPAEEDEIHYGYLTNKRTTLRSQESNARCELDAGTLVEADFNYHATPIPAGNFNVTLKSEVRGCGIRYGVVTGADVIQGTFYFGPPTEGAKLIARMRSEQGNH
ncbi:MAG: hypothetical protein R3B54_16110 [Bdellovibrionota bacterium]